MLTVSGLATGYDGLEVLSGVDLSVESGETVCVLGANGAGKSTLLRAIMRQLPAWRGAVRFAGEDMTRRKPHEMARVGMAYVPEGRGMLGSLSVRENLDVAGMVLPDRNARADRLQQSLALFPILVGRLGHPAGNLSGGQAQMLAIARALMCAPKLIVLDEPSLGLAPQVVGQVYAALTALKRAGQAILLVEQAVAKALELSDRAYVLDRGRMVLSGSARELQNSEALRGAYLGL